MPGDTDAELGHQNLISYSRAITGWGTRAALLEDHQVLLFAGGSWIPIGGNGAFRLDDGLAAADLVERADAFFAGLRRGYSIKVRDDGSDADIETACESAGLVAFGEPVPQMVCRQRLDDPDLPEGIELRPVTTAEGLADFVHVNTDAYSTYGMPSDVLSDWFDRPDGVLSSEGTFIVVAYRNATPLATALCYLDHGVAGLQWVGTVAEARHLRLADAVTRWATNTAYDHGAASCSLQASPMGEPLYRKLGYETRYHYREYVRWKVPVTG
jgi:hypothetical protein